MAMKKKTEISTGVGIVIILLGKIIESERWL
jgi:hypothetical protein